MIKRLAARDVVASYVALQRHLQDSDPNSDVFSLLAGGRKDLVQLATHLTRAALDEHFQVAALRIAADIQNSPVLSSRLQVTNPLAIEDDNNIEAYGDDAVARLIASHFSPAAIMQCVELEDGLILLSHSSRRTPSSQTSRRFISRSPSLKRSTDACSYISPDAMPNARRWASIASGAGRRPATRSSLPWPRYLAEQYSQSFPAISGASSSRWRSVRTIL